MGYSLFPWFNLHYSILVLYWPTLATPTHNLNFSRRRIPTHSSPCIESFHLYYTYKFVCSIENAVLQCYSHMKNFFKLENWSTPRHVPAPQPNDLTSSSSSNWDQNSAVFFSSSASLESTSTLVRKSIASILWLLSNRLLSLEWWLMCVLLLLYFREGAVAFVTQPKAKVLFSEDDEDITVVTSEESSLSHLLVSHTM